MSRARCWKRWGYVVSLGLLVGGFLPANQARAEARSEAISIRGEVQDSEGLPLAGIRIELLPMIGSWGQDLRYQEGRLLAETESAVTSDERGRFEIRAPRPGFWRLLARSDRHLLYQVAFQPLVEDRQLGAVRLRDAIAVKVRAVDAEGRAVPKAWIAVEWNKALDPKRSEGRIDGWRLAGREVLADDEGRATVLRGESERVKLVAWARGFLESEEVYCGSREAVLTLQKGAARRVEVLDSEKRPAKGALLRLGRAAWPAGRTGEDGALEIAVEPGEELLLDAESESGAHASRLVVFGEEDRDDPPLQLLSPVQVRGRVVDKNDGSPLIGAFALYGDQYSRTVESDGRGRFSIIARPRDRGRVDVAARGYFDEIQVVAEGGGELLFQLERSLSLSGVVIDELGEAIAEASIGAFAKPDSQQQTRVLFSQPIPRAIAQGNGRFRLTGLLPELTYEIAATKTGWAPSRSDVTMGPEELPPVQLVMTKGLEPTVRVTDRDSIPVGGAMAILTPAVKGGLDWAHTYYRSLVDDTFEGKSDASGLVRWQHVPEGRYELTVEAAGYADSYPKDVEIRSDRATDLGEAVLPPGFVLTGRVIDQEARAIEGATIGVESVRTQVTRRFGTNQEGATSSEDGKFEIRDLREGAVLGLVVARKGFVDERVSGITIPASTPLEVRMTETVTVRGIVVAEDGLPIEGANVALRPGLSDQRSRRSRQGRAETDSEGRFTIEDAKPGVLDVEIRADGFREFRFGDLEIPKHVGLDDLRFVLTPGIDLEGRVVDAEDQALSGVAVSLQALRLHRGMKRPPVVVSDAEGRFRLSGLEEGTFMLVARQDDGSEARKEVEIAQGAPPVELRFTRGARVEGLLVTGLGEPVPGASLALVSPGERWRSTLSGRSDSQGAFVFESVPDGAYELLLRHESFVLVGGDEVLEVKGQPLLGLRYEVREGGTIRGRLVGLEAADLVGIEVMAFQDRGRRMSSGRYDDTMEYRIEGLAEGEWTLWARTLDGRQASATALLDPGNHLTETDLVFRDGLELAGRVLLDDTGVAGAQVNVFASSGMSGGSATADHEGRFRIGGLLEGNHQVMVMAYEDGIYHKEDLELVEGEEIEIALRSREIVGVVSDRYDGGPIDGAEIGLSDASASGLARFSSTTSDSTGYFRLRFVEREDFEVQVRKGGYATWEGEIGLFAAGEIEVELTPTQGLRLEIQLASGVPALEVSIAVLKPGGQRLIVDHFRNLLDGRVRLDTVPEGHWTLRLASQGSGVTEIDVQVPSELVPVRLLPGSTVIVGFAPITEGGSSGYEQVFVTDPSGRAFYPIYELQEGSFPVYNDQCKIESLPPGSWTLVARGEEMPEIRRTIQVSGGEELRLEFR